MEDPGDALPDAGDAGEDAGDTGENPLPDGGTDGGEEEEVYDPQAPARIDWSFGAPIDVPLETWTYVPIEGARCGNGSDTGVAVNFTDRSEDVVVFLAPGGACWDVATCIYAGQFGAPLATHIDDVMQGDAVVEEAEAAQLRVVFNREVGSPFRDLNFVYVPYCTADVHAGTRVTHYESGENSRDLHHVGGTNVRRLLERLVPTFPNAERVWLTGASAGGFGATYNWWVAQDAFPEARVDVLNDGAAPVAFEPFRFADMMREWDPETPPGCPDCRLEASALLPYYAERYPPPHRYALATSVRDGTISFFSGLHADVFEQRALLLRDAMGPGQKSFYVPGQNHVLLRLNPIPVSPDGVSLIQWVEQFLSDDPAWDHQGD